MAFQEVRAIRMALESLVKELSREQGELSVGFFPNSAVPAARLYW